MQKILTGLQTGLSRTIRATGQALDTVGRQFELDPHVDRLLPQTRSVKLRGVTPDIQGSFVASSATVIGQVKIGAQSSVWYGAVLRGDDNTITIGENVTIGDRVMVHASKYPKPAPTVVGNKAVINSGAILHGCTVEDGAVIGEGAQVLDNARVGAQAVLAAGSILASNKVVPPRQVWAGVPAKFQRDVSVEELAAMDALVQENLELAKLHAEESAKTWQTIEHEEFLKEQVVDRNPEYYARLTPSELSQREGEIEGHAHPGRILNSPIQAIEELKN